MGAWGAGPFENDDAADWAAEFDGLEWLAGIDVLTAALDLADLGEYVEASDGAVAVAAAQVVSWLNAPDDVRESPYAASAIGWVRSNAGKADDALIDAARRALHRVRNRNSELAELWADADGEEWNASLAHIDSLLGRAT